jgi:chromosome segregation ATPase
MPNRNIIFLPVFFLLFNGLFSQNDNVALRGRVVEVSGGKPVGLDDVKVYAVGQHFDYTHDGGYFTVYVDPHKEFIVFALENCPHPVISPLGKKVSMPPPREVEIRVCAAENKRLHQRVEELEQQVRRIENKRLLTQRQLEHLQDSLLQVVIGHEAKVRNLEEDLLKEGKTADELRTRVEELEKRNIALEEALLDALEERYLRQKKAFDDISATLKNYNDQVKNLRDMAYPNRLSPYFSNPAALEEWNETVRKYNAARSVIVEQQNNHVADVAHYWEDIAIAEELKKTYDYLLEELHGKGVYPMEFTVNENLKQCWGRQKGRIAALRNAKEEAEIATPKLAPLILTSEEKIEQIIYLLKTGL